MPTLKTSVQKVLYGCDADGCAHTHVVELMDVAQGEPLAHPWRRFTIDGWVGNFVACSDVCEARIRRSNRNTP